jgi:hypothetical protein
MEECTEKPAFSLPVTANFQEEGGGIKVLKTAWLNLSLFFKKEGGKKDGGT